MPNHYNVLAINSIVIIEQSSRDARQHRFCHLANQNNNNAP